MMQIFEDTNSETELGIDATKVFESFKSVALKVILAYG